MKLSIIIAMYNAINTISKCIYSVINSSLSESDYEIIVINDGSTDTSAEIVAEIQSKHDNIILINKENGGQSTARNIGFERAKGKYIFSLDSDDYIDSDLLSDLIQYADENNLDMVPIFFKKHKNNSICKSKDIYPLINTPMTGVEFMNKFVVSGCMWRYLYKRDIIVNNSLKLIEGVFHEDEEFVIKYMIYAKRIMYNRLPIYNYLVHDNSTINKPNLEHRIRLLNDLIIVITEINTLIKKHEYNHELIRGLSIKKEQLLIGIFTRIYNEMIPSTNIVELLKKLREEEFYPLQLKYSPIKFKIAAYFFNKEWFLKIFFKN